MIETNDERFSDSGEMLYDFGEELLVVRPKCAAMAKVVREEIGSDKLNEILFAPRRPVYLKCVGRDFWNVGEIGIGASVDWYFRLPLWLQTECVGETLRAYNEKHLEFIENYVAAKLRIGKPSTNKSLASRLPRRIKSAKNRDEVLKACEKLKAKLNGKS